MRPYSQGLEWRITPDDPSEAPERCRVRSVCFDPGTLTVQFLGEGRRWLYEVDLERAKTPQELLSWCFHIMQKDWGTPQVVGAMLKIVDRVVWESTQKPGRPGVTAEHCYCYRKHDSHGKEQDGFDWTKLQKSGYGIFGEDINDIC